MDEPERGTFCVVIHNQLAVSYCPLPNGTCMWKHRVSGRCMYSEDFAATSFTPNDFATRVGLPTIPGEVVNIIKRTVIAKIRDELAT